MGSKKLTMEDFLVLGWPKGPMIGKAIQLQKEMSKRGVAPEAFLGDISAWEGVRLTPATKKEAKLASEISAWMAKNKPAPPDKAERQAMTAGASGTAGLFEEPCPFRIWGGADIDPEAIQQMREICRIAPAARGALMPDAHVGYSMPIGGVLATRNAVIPTAVGVDIACRMRLTITTLPWDRFEGMADKLRKALVGETRFGVGAAFNKRDIREHDVMDDGRWAALPGDIRAKKDTAWEQLGSSGGGNHFAEWGAFSHSLTPEEAEKVGLGALEPNKEHIALLSHSGSRGLGARTAEHFIHLAQDASPLPKEWRRLGWLPLQSALGEQYWNCMNLCGDYASANHQLIHKHVLKTAGLSGDVALFVENHHNFAWKETHDGEELIVHRKGATPAGEGVLGVIPGSMADPGFLVQGLGSEASLNSASHGAGRKMSRKGARERITPGEWRGYMKEHGVELLGGGIDEAPQAYKDIRAVMANQGDLARILGQFEPRVVLMASDQGAPKWARGKRGNDAWVGE
jgi:tRNA-splicing ligase RtcB